MSSYRNILYLIVIFILAGGSTAIASDENPWSMDDPDEQRQPFYELGGRAASGPFVGGPGLDQSTHRPPVKQAQRLNETTRSKSPSLAQGLVGSSAAGKQDREDVFGYAGPQSQKPQGDLTSPRNNQFGAFPPRTGMVEEKAGARTSGQQGGSVQFRGKTFGAFPPKASKPADRQRRRMLELLRERQKLMQKRQSSAFANVPPPPVPEPVPEYSYPYPYSGYGRPPGRGTPYGSPYGPAIAPPGVPGRLLPGLVW